MSEKAATAYPLFWPLNKPRTPIHQRRLNRTFKTSFADARDQCQNEVKLMGGTDLVISTNIPLKRDGVAYAQDWNKPLKTDNGVAVYFNRKDRPMCFACDTWTHVQDNMHAIALTIEALRGIARWGSGDMMEAAFSGFRALPAVGQTSGSNWWQVLGVPINASPEQVKDAYRILVTKHHPDKNGDVEKWHRLQEAWEQFERIQKV